MIQLIDTKNMDFIFVFSTRDCYKLFSGVCSLEIEEKPQIDEKNQAYCGKWNYCRGMYQALLEKRLPTQDIRVQKWLCGHHTIIDGQHRICMARSKQIESMIINLSLADSFCGRCSSKI